MPLIPAAQLALFILNNGFEAAQKIIALWKQGGDISVDDADKLLSTISASAADFKKGHVA